MPNRTNSEIQMENLQNSYIEAELTERQKHRLGWENAVTNELKLFFEKQNTLEQTVKKWSSPDDEESFANKLDAAINLLTTLSADVEAQKVQIANLESENLTLTRKYTQLKLRFENYIKAAPNDDDLQALKQHCLTTISETVIKINQDLNENRTRIDEIIEQIGEAPAIATNIAPRKFKIDMPKFKGHEQESPMKFLADLRQYVLVTKPSRTEFQCIISQALEDSAKNWWFLQEQDVTNLEDFTQKFKDHFWNAAVQRNAKRKVEFGKFNITGKQTRVE